MLCSNIYSSHHCILDKLYHNINKFACLGNRVANMAKIIVLGSAGDIEALKTGRSSGGLFLEVDDIRCMFDPGIGSITRGISCGVPLSEIEAIFVSSTDLIATNDMHALMRIANHPTICASSNVWDATRTITESGIHSIKGLDVEIIPFKDDALAFKIHTSRFVLSYIPTLPLSKKILEKFKETNILIVLCRDASKESLFDLLNGIDCELAVLTGFGSSVLADDILELSRSLKKALLTHNNTRMQIIAAKDGMVINPDSYNIKLKQKKLKGFM